MCKTSDDVLLFVLVTFKNIFEFSRAAKNFYEQDRLFKTKSALLEKVSNLKKKYFRQNLSFIRSEISAVATKILVTFLKITYFL